jgi:Uncharacterized conserved protein
MFLAGRLLFILHKMFASYALDIAWDEMFTADGQPRPHYLPLYERLTNLSAEELYRRQQAADATFLNQGITFAVYGHDDGTEKIFPYDLIPRIIPGIL